MPKAIKVNVDVPPGTSNQDTQSAQRRAEKAAVLTLWEFGSLSTRQAAAELGLEYYAFMDLLTERGIPYESDTFDPAAVETARRKIAERWRDDTNAAPPSR